VTPDLRVLQCLLHRQRIRALCTWGPLPVASGDLGRNGCPVRLVQWQRMSFELHSLPLSRAKMEREHGPEGGQGCGRDRVAQRSLRIADGHLEKALEENWEDQEDRQGHERRRCAWLQIYAGTWSRVQEPVNSHSQHLAVSLFPNSESPRLSPSGSQINIASCLSHDYVRRFSEIFASRSSCHRGTLSYAMISNSHDCLPIVHLTAP